MVWGSDLECINKFASGDVGADLMQVLCEVKLLSHRFPNIRQGSDFLSLGGDKAQWGLFPEMSLRRTANVPELLKRRRKKKEWIHSKRPRWSVTRLLFHLLCWLCCWLPAPAPPVSKSQVCTAEQMGEPRWIIQPQINARHLAQVEHRGVAANNDTSAALGAHYPVL